MFDPTYYEGPWRRLWHTRLRGDLYPTHGFGPIANYMDVNRGDLGGAHVQLRHARAGARGIPRGPHAAGRPELEGVVHRERPHLQPPADRQGPGAAAGARCVHTARRTAGINSLGGTKGVFEDYPERIYIEPDQSNDQWGDFSKYAEWDHWLWKEHANPPGGHGGMDYIMLFRIMQCFQLGLVPDFDVYDAATWSAPVMLSHASIKAKGEPQEFPDFTRGLWRKPRQGVDSPKPTA
ncbi:Glycosyl hydrolase family 109 protein OS=Streptomyces rimosus subsp. rimosus (strain ATCC /DSM 40260 / JCM 4667 / NRRL 2234) OX=1265868 GN=SRIM_036105 PE=3 SV=1 [Streptomyces rimosus subsp. rimosus]